ncbi:MAG TPA: hypothetical protein VH092_02015 [Urbifossiella sp.]|nr:hypothetical protein [Urbifossiella sp.]
MTRIRLTLVALVVASLVIPAIGCGGAKQEEKQPKLQSPPDPKIKGPAQPGGAGSSPVQ